MDDDYLSWGFDALPKEIRVLIFSLADLDLRTVLSAQAVSSEFKKLCWAWMREYDTSLLSKKEGAPAAAAQFIDRLTPNLITRIDFSQFLNAVESAPKIVLKFPNLQRIRVGSEVKLYNLASECTLHPKLCEVSSEADGVFYRTDLEDGFSPYYDLEYLNEGSFTQNNPMAFNRNYHRGGILSDKWIVIGASDGTLTFLTLDLANQNLVLHSTKHGIHKNCINVIWCEKEILSGVIPPTYIASYDGIVTSWICTNDAPELKQTFTLPESILFVCDFASNYLLAAGKRTLYICDTQTAKIIRKIAVDEDITGLFSNPKGTVMSTIYRLYSINEDVASTELLHKLLDTYSPNMWLSPDISLRMTVLPNKIELVEYEIPETDPHPDFGDNFKETFDPRPHLARFSPIRYWMTASTGPSIITYDLESKVSIGTKSPKLSRLGRLGSAFPTCNSLWYSPCGNYLFGLFSNDTLYWWHMSYHY